MALAIDASTPARWSGTPAVGTDISSASFTAPSGALLVVCVRSSRSSAGTTTCAVADTGTLTWTKRAERDQSDASAQNGHAAIFTATTVSAVSRTVQVRRTVGQATARRLICNCYVVTGQDSASPVGATGEGSSTTNNVTPTIFTSTAANSMAFVAASEWNALGAPTSSDLTEDGETGSQISSVSGYKTLGATGSQTANLDAGGTGTAAWNWAAIEVKPGATAISGSLAATETGADDATVAGHNDGISIDPVTGILSIDTDITGPLAGRAIKVRATNVHGFDEDTFTITVS